MSKRTSCRASKNQPKCPEYSYSLSRCTLGLVKATCGKIQEPRQGTKAARNAADVRAFYAMFGG